ncbi:flavin reductase family protein [Amycolatopsis sp. NPDC059027]|uniref:flavin reductase family protein n=1 Tax=unclassified Amycolatopsis TaxID=2618356 RepID=UPI003672F1D6
MDQQTFFAVMSAFPTGVAIVTTSTTARVPAGLTTNALCSISADPPLLSLCIGLSSRTLPALRARKRFIVHFMADRHDAICHAFAGKGDDKFAEVPWRWTESGLPLLCEGVIAWLECSVAQESVVGDHVVLIGRAEIGQPPREDSYPIVYFRRKYRNWSPDRVGPLPGHPERSTVR